jgi:PKD repeat protein
LAQRLAKDLLRLSRSETIPSGSCWVISPSLETCFSLAGFLHAATGLPTGLSVNTTTGLLSGTPTTAGSFSVTLSATNAAGTGSATLALTIGQAQSPPAITSSLTTSGTFGVAFNYQITASNNPTSFNATGLPTGLSVNTTTGLISGTPTTAGSFSVTLSATNAAGTGSATLALTIGQAQSPPAITSSLTASGTFGVAFNYQITASNNPTSFNATGLPTGLSVNTTTGLISGTPRGSGGTFSVTLSATNAAGTGSAKLALTIAKH